jgi:hypothetical protein
MDPRKENFMLTMFLVAAMALGELQNVQVGSGRPVGWPAGMTLHDPLGESLASDAISAMDRRSLSLTFGPHGGADVEDVRAVRMLPGQKHLRVRDVSATLDVAALTVLNPEYPGQVRLRWATLLVPAHTAAAIEQALVGEVVEVLLPGGPLGHERQEGVLLGTGEHRAVAVNNEVHIVDNLPLVFPYGTEKAVTTPTLDLQLEQEGAAKLLTLRYPIRGASVETRYLLELHGNGTVTLTHRAGIYLAEGTAFEEATINIILPQNSNEAVPPLRREQVRLREGDTVWETFGTWDGVPFHQPAANQLVLEGKGILDKWLPAGSALIRRVEDDGHTWTLGTTAFPQTAPGGEAVLVLP